MGGCGSCDRPADWMQTLLAQEVIDRIAEEQIGANDPINSRNETLLHLAARFDRFSVMKWLLGRGGNPSLQDDQGYSALHVAIECNSLHTVKEIIPFVFRTQDIKALRALLSLTTAKGKQPMSLCTFRKVSTSTTATNAGGSVNGTPKVLTQTPRTAALENGIVECDSDAFGSDCASESELKEMEFVSDATDLETRRNSTPDGAISSTSFEAVDNEPLVRGGVISLRALISSDAPPASSPRHINAELTLHYLTTVMRFVFGKDPKAKIQSVLDCVTLGMDLQDLVFHSFQRPSMFVDCTLQLSVVSKAAEDHLAVQAQWHPIVPDCNYSFRALFGRHSQNYDNPSLSPEDITYLRRLEAHAILMTPLQAAIYCNSIVAVKQLLVIGGRAQLFVPDSNGNNALHYAVDTYTRTGSESMLQLFVRHFYETERLLHKTNNNGHRPGQYNETEAVALGLVSELYPIPSIPSMVRSHNNSHDGDAGMLPSHRKSTCAPANPRRTSTNDHPIMSAIRRVDAEMEILVSDDDENDTRSTSNASKMDASQLIPFHNSLGESSSQPPSPHSDNNHHHTTNAAAATTTVATAGSPPADNDASMRRATKRPAALKAALPGTVPDSVVITPTTVLVLPCLARHSLAKTLKLAPH